MPASDPIIHLAGVNKWFGSFHVLKDIDLDVARGERIVIAGPSGSGKSTLIRCSSAGVFGTGTPTCFARPRFPGRKQRNCYGAQP